MEASSKSLHDNKLSSSMLSKHLHSTFMQPFKLVNLLLVLSIEVVCFVTKGQHMSPFFSFTCLLIFFLIYCYKRRSSSVYLVDYSCLKPPSSCKVSSSKFIAHTSKFGSFSSESIDFMAKVIHSSGMSEETYLPPALHHIPPKTHQEEVIKEAHMVLFTTMDDLLTKTKISALEIDILIVNCSGFCPSPSLSSIIINKYSMRDDIKSFNLSGMGCSAGISAVDLGRNLLQIHRNSNVVVLSTEILSVGWYGGNEKHKLLLNCLFRMGGAAILLTNKSKAKNYSKYKLVRSLRTQRIFDDKAYLAAMRDEDSNGYLGVSLTKALQQAVPETLSNHISILGSKILPFSEKFWYVAYKLRNRYMGSKSGETYVPSFKSVIQHFCLPTSGRQPIRELGKSLKLGEKDTEAAMMTLHRFGNQSSSSLWYELAYLEAKEKVKKNDKVWMLFVGTGLKCSSAVWECMRPIVGESENEPWADCIHWFPIKNIG